MNRILIILILVFSVATSFAAQESLSVTRFLGKSSGIFEKPRGEKDMAVTGVTTNDFSWGKKTAGSTEGNSLKFQGEGFISSLDKEFKIGEITYYNSTTATGTNASMVELKITLTFDDKSQAEFSMPINFISTPNTGTHKDNADIIKIENSRMDKTVRINEKLYSVNLKFGKTSEYGFSNVLNEFAVMEGFNASASLVAVIVPYTAPPPLAKASKPGKAIPIVRGYGFKTAHKYNPSHPPLSKAQQNPKIEKPILSNSNAVRSHNATTTHQNKSHLSGHNIPAHPNSKTKISLPPSKIRPTHSNATQNPLLPTKELHPNTKHLDSNPSHPTANRIALPPSKSNTPRLPAQEHPNPHRLALSSSKVPSAVAHGKLSSPNAHNRNTHTTSTPPKMNRHDFKASTPTKGQITYLDSNAYSVFRSVGVRINTEHGRTYVIQVSTDKVNWSDFSQPIVGNGQEIIIHEEIKAASVRDYRIKVTQTN